MKFLLLFLIVNAPMTNAATLNYDELPLLVQKGNLHVRSGERELDAKKAKDGVLTRSFLPKIGAGIGVETFRRELLKTKTQPYASIGAELNLFNGGRDYLQSQIQREEVLIGETIRELSLREELLKARVNFWDMAYYQELIGLLEVKAKRNAKHLSSARARIAAGSATQSDEMEFIMSERLIDQDLSRAKVLREVARQKLTVLIGREPKEELSIETSLPKEALVNDDLFKKDILPSMPESDANRALSRKALLEKQQKTLWWVPKLNAYSSISQMSMLESDEFRATDRQEVVVGLKLTFDLFDGGESYAERTALKMNSLAEQDRAVQTERELLVEYDTSLQELRQLANQVQEASKDVALAEKFLERILSEYSRGVKSSSEVLSASDRSFEFQQRFAELRRDFQVSKATIQSFLQQENK
jgi:outer membrane protein TolC